VQTQEAVQRSVGLPDGGKGGNRRWSGDRTGTTGPTKARDGCMRTACEEDETAEAADENGVDEGCPIRKHCMSFEKTDKMTKIGDQKARILAEGRE